VPYASALSEHPLATHATGEVVGQVLEALGEQPDFAVLFTTAGFAGALEDIAATVRATLRPHALIGATAVSVLAGAREVEEQPAITLFAGRLPPGTSLPAASTIDAVRGVDGWQISGTADLAVPGATVILLADPFTFPVDAFVTGLADSAPGLRAVGGLASAGDAAGQNRLVADDVVTSHGAVALLLPPGLDTTLVVSQGCRPIGEPRVVTRAEGNVVYEIAGEPALEHLMGVAASLSAEDRALLADGAHFGIVVDEAKVELDRGDFLIRNVLGADRDNGAVAVGAEVEIGSTVQFQVRDATTADEDVRRLLAGTAGAGALVFTCNGRGERFFGVPDHDAEVVSDHVESGAVAGMFCAGEIGPVGDRPFVHGLTASVLLFDR